MVKKRFATKEDVSQIQDLAKKHYITQHQDIETKGATCAIYRTDVLEHIISDNLSFIAENEEGIQGYLLACDGNGFYNAFGKTIDQALADYGYEVRGSKIFLPQACISDSIRDKGTYFKLHQMVLDTAKKRKNFDYAFGEILELNRRSKKVHEYLGYQNVASRTTNSLDDFKGNDEQLLKSLKQQYTPDRYNWLLMQKVLN